MALNRLDGDEKLGGHLAIGVAAGNQAHDFLLARGESIQFVVFCQSGIRCLVLLEGGEHESSQLGGEDSVPFVNLTD